LENVFGKPPYLHMPQSNSGGDGVFEKLRMFSLKIHDITEETEENGEQGK
jgi:hypothetical protein